MSSTAILKWTDPIGTGSWYQVYYSTTKSTVTSGFTHNLSGITATTVNPSGLSTATKDYYSIERVCSGLPCDHGSYS
jgi:hypothetical protein